MNIERFKLVRDHVAKNHKFDMDISYNACGSPACVIGSAATLAGFAEPKRFSPDSERLADWLGVTRDEFFFIFLGHFSEEVRADITKEETLEFLDWCIENERIMI